MEDNNAEEVELELFRPEPMMVPLACSLFAPLLSQRCFIGNLGHLAKATKGDRIAKLHRSFTEQNFILGGDWR